MHILQFFAHSHLPPHLAEVSRPFGELAERLAACLPDNPERDVALRKLLEAKDAAGAPLRPINWCSRLLKMTHGVSQNLGLMRHLQ